MPPGTYALSVVILAIHRLLPRPRLPLGVWQVAKRLQHGPLQPARAVGGPREAFARERCTGRTDAPPAV